MTRTAALVCPLLLFFGNGVVGAQPASDVGTRAMVERLAKLPASLGPPGSEFFANERRARELLRQSRTERDPSRQLELSYQAAENLVQAGLSEEAAAELRRLLEGGRGSALGPTESRRIRRELAVAYLRQGEQANCFLHHNSESCLFPIKGSGVHSALDGSQKAIAVLEPLLREQNELDLRWLLNLAYMTLGRYPAGVPIEWRILPEAFESKADIGRFHDIAPKLGIGLRGNAGGCILDDFENNGRLDLFVSSTAIDGQLRYFHRNADGTFTERTNEAGLKGLVEGLNIVQGDYDNDGYLDVLVLRGGWLRKFGEMPLSLLHNNRDGTFSDVTAKAGLWRERPTQAAAFGDFDGDGKLDIVVGNESGGWGAHPLELFHNHGDGTFSDVAADSGAKVVGWIKTVAWGDYDNDGRPDVLITRMDGPPLLLHNDGRGPNGRWGFHDVAPQLGVRAPTMSFPGWFFDFNNDGNLDIFISGYFRPLSSVVAEYLGRDDGPGSRAQLYRNDGGRFTDVSDEAGLHKHLLTMGSNFGDLNNDGYPDMYLGTGAPSLDQLVPNRMFLNERGKRFIDITTSAGVGHLQKGHGVCMADLDHDGNLDIFEVMGGAYTGDTAVSVMYANPGKHHNHFINLKLEGVTANRSAIGARIEVVVGGTEEGRRSIHGVVSSGGSFGASPLEQHLGLGRASRIEEIRVRWPVASGYQLENQKGPIALDAFYRLRQGDGRLIAAR